MGFPTYPEMRRVKGGILKGLYNEIKKLAERNDDQTKYFQSEELTGTGEAQAIPHELGAAPSVVMISLTHIEEEATITEGTHGTANVNVTVTEGAKFKVLAIK